MAITNEQFLKERFHIADMLRRNDPNGEYVSTVPLQDDLFVSNDESTYQILGVNSSFVKNKYVEIFIAIDVTETMRHFNEKAVKTFYFNIDSLAKTDEVEGELVRKQYDRASWRRFQKYLKKEKNKIVKNTEYSLDQ